jgi:prevent-host-death family protein
VGDQTFDTRDSRQRRGRPTFDKSHLSELVRRVSGQHERVTVTVHGRPSAVLLAVDDLEALEETIAVLSDTEAMRRRRPSE